MEYDKVIQRRLQRFIQWYQDRKTSPPWPHIEISDDPMLGSLTGRDSVWLDGAFRNDLFGNIMGFQDVLDRQKVLPPIQEENKFSTLAQNIVDASEDVFLDDAAHYESLRRVDIDNSFADHMIEFVKSRGKALDPGSITDDAHVDVLIVTAIGDGNSSVIFAQYLNQQYMRYLLSDMHVDYLKEPVKIARENLAVLMS